MLSSYASGMLKVYLLSEILDLSGVNSFSFVLRMRTKKKNSLKLKKNYLPLRAR